MVSAPRHTAAFNQVSRSSTLSRASLDKSLPSRPALPSAKATMGATTHGGGPNKSDHHQQHHYQSQPRSAATTTTTTTTSSSASDDDTTTILVGQRQQKFVVNRRLLCAASPFFRERLDDGGSGRARRVSLWLPGESASMFAFFVEWLHAPRSFRRLLEHTLAASRERGPANLLDLQWALVRLHLFASHLGLHHLQDLAMDAVQDLYLGCNWDVGPELVSYLYTKCEAIPAVRLRRWAVAMVAFSLTGNGGGGGGPMSPVSDSGSLNSPSEAFTPSRIHHLLDTLPEFAADHAVHMDKMADSGLDVRFKNPQLRIPANKLRNEERAFGFRQCSFHSHRASVGERRCPYERRSAPRPPPGSLPLGRRESTGGHGRGETQAGGAPAPLFSVNEKDEDGDKALKHVRSISSTMK
ncbi:hypothetical protein N3K66_002469 [Trichothecium roseum]|uniref:Uncharacterized protein n=1 Tax=Trichothecium roseum TaxID=47278 RepID=A0ACC0V9L7_9HYPO|nr:hypothetical protein N3K66_002469 [Trichothecium roseum]